MNVTLTYYSFAADTSIEPLCCTPGTDTMLYVPGKEMNVEKGKRTRQTHVSRKVEQRLKAEAVGLVRSERNRESF